MEKELLKSKFQRGFKARAERHSIDFRSLTGVKVYEFLSAFVLAKHLGIKITTPEDFGMTQSDLATLCSTRKDEWSGVALKSYDGSFLIIHNKSHSLGRQESNIMHELAHVICGHEMSGIENRSDLPFILRTYDEIQENEANWLGSCLQLPRPALTWAIRRGMDEAAIANHFCASLEMVRFRLNMTGVKKQFGYKRN